MGAYDQAHWQTQCLEIKAASAFSRVAPFSRRARRRHRQAGQTDSRTEAQAYGVLLDPSIDTAAPFMMAP